MDNKKYIKLISRDLSGDISHEELNELKDWINQSKGNQETYELYFALWSGTKIKRTSKNSEIIYSGISAAIQEDKYSKLERKSPRNSKSIYYFVAGIAASLLFFVIVFFTMWDLNLSQENHLLESNSNLEKSLPRGQKMKIFLSDGSTVWLNAESSISYPERFSDSLRIVSLKGEAFFDVAKDSLKPFIVRTENFDVKVLGTSFNIKNYPEENSAEVSLENGKVLVNPKITDQKEDFVLFPGEGVELDKESRHIEKISVDPKLSFHWKDGVIYFHKAGFEEVINKLSRWYGVEFELINYRGDKWVYSAEFKNDYLNNILMSMSYSKKFKYQINQNKVTLYFN